MQEYFDADVLRNIESMDVVIARQTCLDMVQASKTKASKKQHLISDLQRAPNSRELSRIMWNVMLSGMGLAIADSQWQKLHS